jgi:hypothetical protein
LLGFFLTYFTRCTGSILAPILSHFLFNFITVFTQYGYYLADPGAFGTATVTAANLTLEMLALFLNALLFLPVFGFLFSIFIRYNLSHRNLMPPDLHLPAHPPVVNWSFWGCLAVYVGYTVFALLL